MARIRDSFLAHHLNAIHSDLMPDVARLVTLATNGDIAAGEALVRRCLDGCRFYRAAAIARGLQREHGAHQLQPFVNQIANHYFVNPFEGGQSCTAGNAAA